MKTFLPAPGGVAGAGALLNLRCRPLRRSECGLRRMTLELAFARKLA
jgi:hypothetical protein